MIRSLAFNVFFYVFTLLTAIFGIVLVPIPTPVALLPDWIEWASNVQPFTPAVDLMRHVLLGLPMPEAAWLAVLKLVLFATVLLPVAVLALNRAVRIGTRRGTIIEY
jgi:ABC-type multidrug transport system permease subunit